MAIGLPWTAFSHTYDQLLNSKLSSWGSAQFSEAVIIPLTFKFLGNSTKIIYQFRTDCNVTNDLKLLNERFIRRDVSFLSGVRESTELSGEQGSHPPKPCSGARVFRPRPWKIPVIRHRKSHFSQQQNVSLGMIR